MSREQKNPVTDPIQENVIPPALQVGVPDAYSNNSHIIIGMSDVAIAFLQDIGFSNSTPQAPQKAIVRIVMSHASFLSFVSYCNSRAKFIQDGYDGPIPDLSLKERSVEEINKSFEDMQSRKTVVARFEFADQDTESGK